MAAQLLLLNEFLPCTALTLGSLVESLKDPIADAFTPSRALPEDAVLGLPVKTFSALLSNSSDTSFRLALTRLLETSHSMKNAEDTKLESVLVRRYKLKQPRELFSELCTEDSKARRWLESGIRAGRKSYLVVELQTAFDAVITRHDSHGHETKADLTVPVSTIATGGADVLGLGQALDSGAGVGLGRSNSLKKSFTIEGENIFAIGYKKVTWKSWGFKKKLEKAVLSGEITWSIMGQKRGREDTEEVISVDLTDDVKAKAEEEEEEEEEEDEYDDNDDDEEVATKSVEVDGQIYLVPGDVE